MCLPRPYSTMFSVHSSASLWSVHKRTLWVGHAAARRSHMTVVEFSGCPTLKRSLLKPRTRGGPTAGGKCAPHSLSRTTTLATRTTAWPTSLAHLHVWEGLREKSALLLIVILHAPDTKALRSCMRGTSLQGLFTADYNLSYTKVHRACMGEIS